MNLINLLESRVLGFSPVFLKEILAQRSDKYYLATERDSYGEKYIVIYDNEENNPQAASAVSLGRVGSLSCVKNLYGLPDGKGIKETSRCFEIQKHLLGESIGHQSCLTCHLRATDKLLTEDLCLKNMIPKKVKSGNKKITSDVFS